MRVDHTKKTRISAVEMYLIKDFGSWGFCLTFTDPLVKKICAKNDFQIVIPQ